MNIGQLKYLIAELPDDLEIVMANDTEGNGYSPLDEAVNGRYIANSTWSGDVIHPDGWNDYPDATPALVLWPVN